MNQQAIWKAQGIDLILKQAWDRGIVLGGASAGSLSRSTRERPTPGQKSLDGQVPRLPEVQPLPTLNREAPRRPLYMKLIASRRNGTRLRLLQRRRHYFEDNEVKRVVKTRPEANAYFVSRSGNEAVEKLLPAEMIS